MSAMEEPSEQSATEGPSEQSQLDTLMDTTEDESEERSILLVSEEFIEKEIKSLTKKKTTDSLIKMRKEQLKDIKEELVRLRNEMMYLTKRIAIERKEKERSTTNTMEKEKEKGNKKKEKDVDLSGMLEEEKDYCLFLQRIKKGKKEEEKSDLDIMIRRKKSIQMQYRRKLKYNDEIIVEIKELEKNKRKEEIENHLKPVQIYTPRKIIERKRRATTDQAVERSWNKSFSKELPEYVDDEDDDGINNEYEMEMN